MAQSNHPYRSLPDFRLWEEPKARGSVSSEEWERSLILVQSAMGVALVVMGLAAAALVTVGFWPASGILMVMVPILVGLLALPWSKELRSA